MRFKTPKQPPLDHAGAEDLAASALAFLTSDPARLTRFMTDTGLDPQTLATRLADGGAGVIEAALEHILSDESLLLVFASEVRRKPEEVMAAQQILAGPAPYRSI